MAISGTLEVGKLYKILKNPDTHQVRANSSIMVLGSGLIYATNKDAAPTALSQMAPVKSLQNDIGIIVSDLYTYIAITGATEVYIRGTQVELIGDIS